MPVPLGQLLLLCLRLPPLLPSPAWPHVGQPVPPTLPRRGAAPFADPHSKGEGVPPLVPTPPYAVEPEVLGLFVRWLRSPSTSAFSVSLLPAAKASDADAVEHSSRCTPAWASCFQNSRCNPVVFSIRIPSGKTWGAEELGPKGREWEGGNIPPTAIFFFS